MFDVFIVDSNVICFLMWCYLFDLLFLYNDEILILFLIFLFWVFVVCLF